MGMISIVIPVIPVSWKAHGGYGRRAYNPRHEEREYYRFEIKKQYKHNFPLTCAVKINYFFYLPIPSSSPKRVRDSMERGDVPHIKRPDTSNLVKFFEDTLKELVIRDDSQVVEFIAKKFYSTNPRSIAEINIAEKSGN